MESELMLDEKNLITMKLLHYFITEKNYNPIILQGVENEIWLENLEEDCKVVRIVSSYIHNDEQFKFDVFKTKRIVKKIKRKTFSLNMDVFSIFLDLGDNITADINENPHLMSVKINEESDIKKNSLISEKFPDLSNNMKYTEHGIELFMKITGDINKHNQDDATRLEDVFKAKVPYVTYFLIAVSVFFYIVPVLFGELGSVISAYGVHGPSIRFGQYYRIITGTFLHANMFHILFNMYALYIIGSQLEGFFGRFKYLIIYLFSAVTGSLLAITLNGDVVGVGASGAIFGLMGALLYFGYHYRVYLGNVLKSQIIPLIALNLFISFLDQSIDASAHIGGLIGGIIISIALGVKDKSSTFEKVNGFIIALLFLVFLGYMGFVMAAN